MKASSLELENQIPNKYYALYEMIIIEKSNKTSFKRLFTFELNTSQGNNSVSKETILFITQVQYNKCGGSIKYFSFRLRTVKK